MIIKVLQNPISKLRIFIGLKEVQIDVKELPLTKLVDLSDYIDKAYNNALFQIINSNYILNSGHIYNACYFAYNSFLSHNNISKSKEIELLLYLSVNRQINTTIRDFGLQYDKKGPQNYIICLVSPKNNLDLIWNDIKQKIDYEEHSFSLDEVSSEKIARIKNYFEITENQLAVIIRTYESNNDLIINKKIIALTDSIREKMALLSIEKT